MSLAGHSGIGYHRTKQSPSIGAATVDVEQRRRCGALSPIVHDHSHAHQRIANPPHERDISLFPASSRVLSAAPRIGGDDFARYIQMYSSAMAPLRHLATVTMRLPPSSSPTTQVHSPDPNRIG